jgi:predicted PurR-regulated permease PerM
MYQFNVSLLFLYTTLNILQQKLSCLFLLNNLRFGLSLVLISGLVFGIVLPLLICIIPQLWKRLDSISNSSTTTTTHSDEAHPFIPMNAGNQRSIARNYNDSPTFHRIPHVSDDNPYGIKQNGTSK